MVIWEELTEEEPPFTQCELRTQRLAFFFFFFSFLKTFPWLMTYHCLPSKFEILCCVQGPAFLTWSNMTHSPYPLICSMQFTVLCPLYSCFYSPKIMRMIRSRECFPCTYSLLGISVIQFDFPHTSRGGQQHYYHHHPSHHHHHLPFFFLSEEAEVQFK